MLPHWLGNKKDGEQELLQAVADMRLQFRSKVNSAALVVYGLPLIATRKATK